jgi:hypothetical protein
MKIVRIMASLSLAAGLFAGSPASAQFFLKSYDFSGAAVTGAEPEMGMPMPGATPAEVRAGLVWNMRAALNVAALQCDFAPMLLTVDNYNAMLRDHSAELKASLEAINGYFVRTSKTKAAGQAAFDRFGTRTYSAFATVAAQYGDLHATRPIGRRRGHLYARTAQQPDPLWRTAIPARLLRPDLSVPAGFPARLLAQGTL